MALMGRAWARQLEVTEVPPSSGSSGLGFQQIQGGQQISGASQSGEKFKPRRFADDKRGKVQHGGLALAASVVLRISTFESDQCVPLALPVFESSNGIGTASGTQVFVSSTSATPALLRHRRRNRM